MGARRIDFLRIGQIVPASEPTIAVQDNSDMARHLQGSYLREQPAFIKAINQ